MIFVVVRFGFTASNIFLPMNLQCNNKSQKNSGMGIAYIFRTNTNRNALFRRVMLLCTSTANHHDLGRVVICEINQNR